jgi:hypothetical protein
MSHPIVRALGDYLQLPSTQGLLRALQLEPRHGVFSRTFSSLKLLGAGIAIGRGIDLYGETILDYARRARQRRTPRALSTAAAVAVGVGIGVGAAILIAPEVKASLWPAAKTPSPSPSPPVSASFDSAARGDAPPTNGASG